MLSFFYLVLICYFIFISFMMISIMEKLYDFLVQNHPNPTPNPSNEQNNETIHTTEQNVMEIPDLVVETLRNREQANCSICTEPMISNLSTTPCGHLFHTSCLQTWMNQGTNQHRCPICRSNISSQNEQNQVRRRNQTGNAQVELTTFSRVFNMDEVRELLENL